MIVRKEFSNGWVVLSIISFCLCLSTTSSFTTKKPYYRTIVTNNRQRNLNNDNADGYNSFIGKSNPITTGIDRNFKKQNLIVGMTDNNDDDDDGLKEEWDRRKFMKELCKSTSIGMVGLSSFLYHVEPSEAGEVGAKITKAVTQSDLGISVRKSVVKSAQIADQLDGKWEKFSDTYGLGAERSKRDARPKPKDIPPLQPLNSDIATLLLQASDKAFLSQFDSSNDRISENDLKSQIIKVDNLVRKSFERSGLDLTGTSSFGTNIQTAEQFNFYSYVRYKAYCDLLVEKKVAFPKFKQNYERMLGEQSLGIILTSQTFNASGSSREESLNQVLRQLDTLCKNLQSYGLVALAERNQLEDRDAIVDFMDDMADLQFSVALDGDVTQNAQILLQEQGFRLYPSFAKVAIAALLLQQQKSSLKLGEITIDDYYMDTNYNSDPDSFEVKEILLNIVLTNP